MPNKKYYYIPSKNKTECFTIQCEDTTKDGRKCYLACATNGEEAWLYDNAVEYIKQGKYKNKHTIVQAYEVPPPIGLNPNQYLWGVDVRDKRSRSMCPRPYFPR